MRLPDGTLGPVPDIDPPSGPTGMDLRSGDHVCCFYSGTDERDEILLAYLAAGVRHGDKCICLIDATDPELVRAQVDRRREAGPGQLVVQAAAEAYLRPGRFSSVVMIDYLEETIGSAVGADGFPFVRAVGEMSWVLREPPGAEELFSYESALNDFAPRYPQSLLCMYDVRRFGGGMLVDAFLTHPKLLVGNMLVENPWFATSGAGHAPSHW